jgi:hypothetical protein
MTKKHFIALAKAISKIENEVARRLAADAVAEVAAETNSRFNYLRFMSACGVK